MWVEISFHLYCEEHTSHHHSHITHTSHITYITPFFYSGVVKMVESNHGTTTTITTPICSFTLNRFFFSSSSSSRVGLVEPKRVHGTPEEASEREFSSLSGIKVHTAG